MKMKEIGKDIKLKNDINKTKKILLLILVLIGCITIFCFSEFSANDSSKQSRGVTYNILKALNRNKLTEKELTKLTKKVNPVIRKIAHFSIYMFLAMFVYMFTEEIVNNNSKKYIEKHLKDKEKDYKYIKIVITTIVFCVIYAIFDEIHQIYVPGRTGKAIDVIIDTLGSLVGITLMILKNKIKNKG